MLAQVPEKRISRRREFERFDLEGLRLAGVNASRLFSWPLPWPSASSVLGSFFLAAFLALLPFCPWLLLLAPVLASLLARLLFCPWLLSWLSCSPGPGSFPGSRWSCLQALLAVLTSACSEELMIGLPEALPVLHVIVA